MHAPVRWPQGKRFAFTIFDDPDGQTLADGQCVYSFLGDLGFRTTKGVWPVRGTGKPSDIGGTCSEPGYRAWAQQLQAQGFEIGFHNTTLHTSTREETIAGLEKFREYFGCYPKSMANHFYCREGMYWGDARITGVNRMAYNVATRWRNYRVSHGHRPGHPLFWGDICRERIKYVRNFVFPDINTLTVCPFMPYHDPVRPYVNYWYASSEGANAQSFAERISEANQERLEEEGGACIMYTHFGHGYCENGTLHPRFRELMERLSKRNGWFVPVTTLLDFLLQHKSDATLAAADRTRLERRWLLHKMRFGTA
jgi:hypothetical protein